MIFHSRPDSAHLPAAADSRANRTPVRSATRLRAGFTLIEIMIVIGIMGIIMTIGVPMVYKVFRKQPLTKAITDVVEVCSHARALAIMQARMVEVVFHPLDGRFEVAGASAPKKRRGDDDIFQTTSGPASSASGLSSQISNRVMIEMLDVNLTEYKNAEEARVRFYPNGTCDELTIILRSDENEWRKISYEVTTGLASVGSVR